VIFVVVIFVVVIIMASIVAMIVVRLTDAMVLFFTMVMILVGFIKVTFKSVSTICVGTTGVALGASGCTCTKGQNSGKAKNKSLHWFLRQ
jgi:hypothetical protein